MSTEKVHFQMKMFGIADRSVNGRIEGQKVQNSRLDAIQQALQRDRAALEQLTEIDELRERYHALTAREREVMTHVISGMLNKHIAAKIGASEATVKIHRGHVMEKMQAGSLIELVRMGDRLNLPPR